MNSTTRPRSAPIVLLDATAIPADRGGVGRYVENLVPELVASGVDLVVVCQQRDEAGFTASGARTIVAAGWAARASGRFAWEQVALPSIARRAGAAVLHSPHYTFPLFSRRKRVVTIHDLTFFTAPEVHSRLKRVFFRSWIRAAKALRLVVVTPSQTTADEYVRITRASPSRVFAAPLGYDTAVFHVPSEADLTAFRSTLVPEPEAWVAFLGTLEPRKNVPALIEGFVSATRSTSPDQRPALLLAGGAGWDEAVAGSVEAARGAGFDIRMLGYAPLEHLRALLGGARVTAYPSLGEGFGLPVLEAMASGACVLTSRELSLPEVGGDAVAYCATDAASIGRELARLLADEPGREAYAAAGIQRAAQFSWARCAARHTVAFAAALGRRALVPSGVVGRHA
ncbi:glycosyltransferase family 4 protein [Subtercola endophyticus]|uniref:glycosyltransferase family 4 protein n=1 Tax=Subtercola endophyticus TaxID=2895559 RepID=UPI001E44458D|nr:glycosyltransferase family 1 protein [Subtercola endophyticus]UFS57749.1 glycosyltransferase family 4 protein [Subtercola endophyticus]